MLTLMVTSKGIAGVPGVSFVVLLATLGSVGIPLEGLAFIAGVDRILDMARTALNVVGNAGGTGDRQVGAPVRSQEGAGLRNGVSGAEGEAGQPGLITSIADVKTPQAVVRGRFVLCGPSTCHFLFSAQLRDLHPRLTKSKVLPN